MRKLIYLATCIVAVGAWAKHQPTDVWTSTDDTSLPADYAVQGEYVGDGLGCQVIALSDGWFHAVVYPGGLPGAGWDGVNKILMDGKTEGGKTVFAPATAPRNYVAVPAERFSAVREFPPTGHKPYTAVIAGKVMTGKTDAGKSFSLKKTMRVSPTMGAKPPAGATVLFDGSSKDAFSGGRLDEKTKLLNTDGKDVRTKKKFNNYVMHVEFMLPYRPEARGQGRGNSGFYQIDHYEMQVLDSFGLDGYDNECGGIYKKARPKVNMCLPPLTWQTYDVEFTNAVVDADGQVIKDAVLTARHNGVVIHDKLSIKGKTGGSRGEPIGTPGPIKFQGHGNPLQYRNIWIVEK